MDGGTQPRARLSDEVVHEYAELLQGGVKLPPVVVYYDGTDYWLADGFHRALAGQAIDRTKISAEVRQGTQRDAVLYSCGVNSEHGLRRTNADKQRAVRKLLEDPEWSRWSDREIARRCAVGHAFVSSLRKELKASSLDLTVHRGQSPSGTTRKPEAERVYTTRHGTPATMRTERIGKAERVPIPDKPRDVVERDRAAIARDFAVFGALESLAGVSVDAETFIASLRKEQRYRVENHLEQAYAWLSDLYAKWG